MASALAHAHIEGQRRLRLLAGRRAAHIWAGLPGYNRANADQWLSEVVPLALATQQSSAALTDAFLAHARGRPPIGVVPDYTAIRNGTTPEAVYERSLITVWAALGKGTQWVDAVRAGQERGVSTIETDTQLAMRDSLSQIERADDGIYGYQRVADGSACSLCLEIDGAYVKNADALPIHNHCGCSVEPLDSPHPNATYLPDGGRVSDLVGIEDHGELGRVLVDPADHFTGPADIP